MTPWLWSGRRSSSDLLLDRRKRLLSLVDAVSFVTMRGRKLSEAFAFDPHFEQEGFVPVH